MANRQLDVWEVAFVWAWPVDNDDDVTNLEAQLFHKFEAKSSLVNGTVPAKPGFKVAEPERSSVQVMTDAEIDVRRQPRYRFPRQVQQFNQLLDYVLHTKDASHLRRALDVHFRRVERFYIDFKKG